MFHIGNTKENSSILKINIQHFISKILQENFTSLNYFFVVFCRIFKHSIESPCYNHHKQLIYLYKVLHIKNAIGLIPLALLILFLYHYYQILSRFKIKMKITKSI